MPHMSCQSLQGGSLLTVVVLFVAGITLQTGAEQTDRHADRQARQTCCSALHALQKETVQFQPHTNDMTKEHLACSILFVQSFALKSSSCVDKSPLFNKLIACSSFPVYVTYMPPSPPPHLVS